MRISALKIVEQVKSDITAVYRQKLDAEDHLAGRSNEAAQSLHFAILAAKRNGTDEASLQRIFGVDSFYISAVEQVHGR